MSVGVSLNIFCVSLVVDVSGSMAGEKLNVLKTGVVRIIDSLAPIDLIDVIAFNDDICELGGEGFANSSGFEAMKRMVLNLRASGGTRLYDAVMAAWLSMLKLKQQLGDGRVQIGGHDITIVPQIIVLTDGEDGTSRSIDFPTCRAALERFGEEYGAEIMFIGLGVSGSSGDLLKALAAACGSKGTYLYLSDLRDLDGLFQRVSLNIQHRVTVMGMSAQGVV